MITCSSRYTWVMGEGVGGILPLAKDGLLHGADASRIRERGWLGVVVGGLALAEDR